jgi:hypothetical protein
LRVTDLRDVAIRNRISGKAAGDKRPEQEG